MFIILTLIVIVAAFNIISGLTILIKNKPKEIAILKTLGLSNHSIKKSFFFCVFCLFKDNEPELEPLILFKVDNLLS